MLADLRVIVERRELLADFAWRELRARYKGSALGFAWNFLSPLLQLLVFLGILLLAWYFLTPILFPISLVASRPRELLGLSLNPMTGIVVGFQRALLDGLAPDWGLLAWSTAVAVAAFVIGFTYFRRAKDDFESAL